MVVGYSVTVVLTLLLAKLKSILSIKVVKVELVAEITLLGSFMHIR
jgi:hypothetical protein